MRRRAIKSEERIFYEKVGENLMLAARRAHLKQKHLARVLGLEQSLISRYFTGSSQIDAVRFKRMICVVGTSVPAVTEGLGELAEVARLSRGAAPESGGDRTDE